MSRIRFYTEDTVGVKFKRVPLKSYLIELIEKEGFICGDINIIFCSDLFLLEMNRSYLNHDYFTDIITFDNNKEKVLSGELYISVDRVAENADLFKVSFPDELFRVIFHGILHLAGYTDKGKKERLMMRKKEDLYLGDYSKID